MSTDLRWKDKEVLSMEPVEFGIFGGPLIEVKKTYKVLQIRHSNNVGGRGIWVDVPEIKADEE
ncbi:MAG: hypothetical protein JKX91_06435 [Rhizobiaceae bacterium]|nr:hypothetical protein [Rhizobiaceae bacterium]